MASMTERGAVVHPPSGWPTGRVLDFAIRKDGSYVFTVEGESAVFQSGPYGATLWGDLSRLVRFKNHEFKDGSVDYYRPVGVSILQDGMSVAIVDAPNSCVRFVRWPCNSVAKFIHAIQHAERIAVRPDGSYLVTGGGKVWNVTPTGSARSFPVGTGWVAPVAALPNGSAVLHIYDQKNNGECIVELEQDGTVHSIAPVVKGFRMEPNYNGRLSEASFSHVDDLAVDVEGRIVVLDKMEVSEAELIAAGVPIHEVQSYAMSYAAVRVIDRTAGTVRTLELVDQKGSPIRNIIQVEGHNIDMGATLAIPFSGGRIAIDGNGNIVFFSTKHGFLLITNTGLAPGLTAYNGHDQRIIHDLKEEIERLRSQRKNSRPHNAAGMVGNSEGVTRPPSPKRSRSEEPKSSLHALHKSKVPAMLKVKEEETEEVAPVERKADRTRRKLECTTCREETDERMALEPCGHVLCCICAEKLSVCPSCSKAIQGRTRFFYA